MPSALEAYPLSQHYRDRSLRDERHVRSSGNVPDDYTGRHVRATRGVTGKLNVNGDLQVKNLGNMRAGQTAYDTGIGWFFGYNGDTPVFSIGDSSPGAPKMLWDGANLTIVGNITATTGAIGGWTIGTTQLTGGDTALDSAGVIKVGTGDNVAQLSSVDSTYRLWVGNASPASAPFRVTQAGALTATGATISGTLTADAGTIGGWNISATGFGGGDVSLNSSGVVEVGSGNNIAILDATDATYRFWVGNATAGSAPFRVTQTGAMTAESGAIGGWTINGTSGIQLGSTANTRGLGTGTWAFFAGDATPSSAPFRVRTDGYARFTDIDVVGGSIDGSVLNVGTVNADRLNVSTLSAISADMGTITAGSITAGSIDVGTLDAGTLNFQTNGTLGSGAGYTGTFGDTGGSLSLGRLTVEDTISFGSGRLQWEGGTSFIDSGGITLHASSATLGDTIQWVSGSTLYGRIQADPAGLRLSSPNTVMTINGGTGLNLETGANALFEFDDNLKILIDSVNQYITTFANDGYVYFPRGIFPSGQTARAIFDDGFNTVITGDFRASGGDVYLGAAGSNEWRLQRETAGTQNIVYLKYNSELGMRLTRQGTDDFDLEVMVGGTWTKIAG